ncbi:lytic murein transglycosylase [Candidatus Parcubacteria bacterium]|nr:lytic murein transglycosylase [Candidatus Parcubacteria bacterium]
MNFQFSIFKQAILFVLILFLVLPSFFLLAEEDLEEICQIENIEKKESELSKEDYEAFLKKCEAYFVEKSKEIEKDINKTEAEKKTLQNKIYSLRKKIQNLNYKINQSNLIIKDLDLQIGDTQFSIEETGLEIEDLKQRLVKLLRLVYEEDQKSLIEIFLSEEEISDFFDNLVALEILNSENQEILDNIKSLKSYLENQKISLDEEKEDRENTLAVYNLQKQENAEIKKEQEYFLKLTEKEYQKYIAEKEETDKTASEIRARIFELVGVVKAPTFGEAYELAKYVQGITGIRPAFLLAILTQESNIGKNVGQCYLKNTKTGEGIYIKTGNTAPKTMGPKSIPKFLNITKELGRDPYSTPVSCCMYYKGKPYGWGGAMGPAQFIPSTWVLYQDKIRAVTGTTPDPWNIKDAFLASGIYLKELGGSRNEFKAAMHYFSGSTWTKYEEFYGRSVISLADRYEKDIAKLESEK